MKSAQDWLAGKKTYLVGIMAILGAVVAWVSGEMDLPAMMAAITAAIMAMTMRAGVAKGEVRRVFLPFAVGSLLLIGGCTGMSNGQRYKIASNTYSTTLNVLSDMRDAGYMTTADRQTVTALRLTAGVILDKMEQDVIDKKTVDFQYMMETLSTILDELLRMQIQAEKVKRETLAGKKVTYDGSRGGIDSQGAHCRRGASRWDNRDGHAGEARLDPGRGRTGPRDTQGSGSPMGRRRITAPIVLTELTAEVEYD